MISLYKMQLCESDSWFVQRFRIYYESEDFDPAIGDDGKKFIHKSRQALHRFMNEGNFGRVFMIIAANFVYTFGFTADSDINHAVVSFLRSKQKKERAISTAEEQETVARFLIATTAVKTSFNLSYVSTSQLNECIDITASTLEQWSEKNTPLRDSGGPVSADLASLIDYQDVIAMLEDLDTKTKANEIITSLVRDVTGVNVTSDTIDSICSNLQFKARETAQRNQTLAQPKAKIILSKENLPQFRKNKRAINRMTTPGGYYPHCSGYRALRQGANDEIFSFPGSLITDKGDPIPRCDTYSEPNVTWRARTKLDVIVKVTVFGQRGENRETVYLKDVLPGEVHKVEQLPMIVEC